MSEGTALTTYITFQADGVMTLNSLTNNYEYPPANGGANPPSCYNFITGNATSPETVPGVIVCGSNSSAQYGAVVNYNLPDGSLITFTSSRDIEFINNEVIVMTAKLSPGSNFSITNSTQSGYSLNVTIEPINS